MLNSCIHHKKSHEQKLHTPNIKPPQSQSEVSSSKQKETKPDEASSNSDTDEEFFEALESHEVGSQGSKGRGSRGISEERVSSPSSGEDMADAPPGRSMEGGGRVGALKQCGDLVLVAVGDPLYIPITQVCPISW